MIEPLELALSNNEFISSIVQEVDKVPGYIGIIVKSGKMTRSRLSSYIGVTRDTLWTWETGRHKPDMISYLLIKRLAGVVSDNKPR